MENRAIVAPGIGRKLGGIANEGKKRRGNENLLEPTFQICLIISLLLHGVLLGAFHFLSYEYSSEYTKDVSDKELRFSAAGAQLRAVSFTVNPDSQKGRPEIHRPADGPQSINRSMAAKRSRFSSDVVRAENSTIHNRIVYPPLARQYGWEGRVTLEVLVNALGRAEKIQVLVKSGYRILEQAAIKGVRNHTFPEGVEPEVVQLTFDFRLAEPE